MPTVKQRGSLVIYVAGSARELPAEVQDWLGRAETRAVASPHIYDMLAQLVQGKKFSAIIVNIQSVDWNEMDFFAQAARLSRGTPIYVSGPYSQRAKIEAACRHGARVFDAVALAESASVSNAEYPGSDSPARRITSAASADAQASIASPDTAEPKPSSFAGVLKLWVSPDEAKPVSAGGNGHRIEELFAEEITPSQAEATADVPVELPVALPDEVSGELPDEVLVEAEETAIEDAVVDEESIRPAMEQVQADPWTNPDAEIQTPEPEMAATEPVSSEAETSSLDSSLPEIQPEPRSAFRLAPVEDEPEPRINFPWSAYPDRPKRIPPRAMEPSVPLSTRQIGDSHQSASASSAVHVRLTPEEIAALMGTPPRSDQAREAP